MIRLTKRVTKWYSIKHKDFLVFCSVISFESDSSLVFQASGKLKTDDGVEHQNVFFPDRIQFVTLFVNLIIVDQNECPRKGSFMYYKNHIIVASFVFGP